MSSARPHAIIGFVDMLRDAEDQSSPTVAGFSPRATLERVRVHACQLLEIIEATLTVSRLEAGRLPIRRVAVPLDRFFASLRAELSGTEVSRVFASCGT